MAAEWIDGRRVLAQTSRAATARQRRRTAGARGSRARCQKGAVSDETRGVQGGFSQGHGAWPANGRAGARTPSRRETEEEERCRWW